MLELFNYIYSLNIKKKIANTTKKYLAQLDRMQLGHRPTVTHKIESPSSPAAQPFMIYDTGEIATGDSRRYRLREHGGGDFPYKSHQRIKRHTHGKSSRPNIAFIGAQ